MGKYMNQLRQLQNNRQTLNYLHSRSLNIAGIEEENNFMRQIQKQNNQAMDEYYSRQITDLLPLVVREAVDEAFANYLSRMDISVSLDGEQLGRIADKVVKDITGDLLKGL